jgi:hypothetical protein
LTDKVVLVGDQNVGKTCLVLRYCEDSFWENYKATIGVDFMWQRYLIQGIGFTLHLWDTAGQEKFRSLSQAYYRGARACIAAFDLGVPESLEHCKHVRRPLHPSPCSLTAPSLHPSPCSLTAPSLHPSRCSLIAPSPHPSRCSLTAPCPLANLTHRALLFCRQVFRALERS